MLGLLEAAGMLHLGDVPPESIRYGIGARGALRVLAENLSNRMVPLLAVVESYHGDPAGPLDGYGALPAFKDRTASIAPPALHRYTLGEAYLTDLDEGGLMWNTVCGKACIFPSTTPPSSPNVLDLGRSGWIPYKCENVATSKPFATISSVQLQLDRELEIWFVAACVSGDHSSYQDFFRTAMGGGTEYGNYDAVPTLLCLICAPVGTRLRKLGLAMVRASDVDWSMETVVIG